MSHPTALQRRHARTVRDSSSSYKIDHVRVILNFLNPEGQQNRISGSKVTAILLKGWSFSGGGSAINGVTPSSFHNKSGAQETLISLGGPLDVFPMGEISDFGTLLYVIKVH